MKKKVLLCVTALILAVVAFCLVACGEQTESVVREAPASGSVLYLDANKTHDFVNCEISFYDITATDHLKLYDFYHLSNFNDLRGSIFRNMSGAYHTDMHEFLSMYEIGKGYDIDVVSEGLDDWQNTSARSNLSFTYSDIDASQSWDDCSVTFFDGRTTKTLADDEIVVSKYAYYTLYADRYGLTITERELRDVIDDEDVFAKYVLLRNCASFDGFVDGVAFEYYGLTDRIENKVITLDLYAKKTDEQNNVSRVYAPKKKIVGYYDVDCSTLAAHKTDLNNMCGCNYDAYHTIGFYRDVLDFLAEGALKDASDDMKLAFMYEALLKANVEVKDLPEILSYDRDEVITAEREGRGYLVRTTYIYGK